MNGIIIAILVVIGIVLVGLAVWAMWPKKEGFSIDGSMNDGVNLGGIVEGSYDLIRPSSSSYADIVSPCESPCGVDDCVSQGYNRLNMDYRDYLPEVNTNVIGYDVDVTDPQVFMFRPGQRVVIHNRQHIGADPFRGDIPIVKDPCDYSNRGWFSSRYGEGDAKLDTYFSEFSRYKYRSLTDDFQVANEGLIMDHSTGCLVPVTGATTCSTRLVRSSDACDAQC